MTITLNGTTGINTPALDSTGPLTSPGIDDNATSTAITIDGSGNVLVGQTSISDYTTIVGTGLRASGFSTHTAAANASLLLNRLTSDGDLVILRKDNVTVGSIGSSGTGVYIDGGSAATGLRFADGGQIVPRRANADADTNVDLGAGTNRFRNILLSGGIYLGGIGSANYLDDYEEGYWVPAIGFNGNTSGVTFTAPPQGEYTKVGRKVTVIISFVLTSKGSNSGNFTCSLPFTSIGSGQGTGVMGYNYNWPNTTNASGYTFQVHSGVLYMMNANSGAFATNGEFNNNTYVSGITVTYFTT